MPTKVSAELVAEISALGACKAAFESFDAFMLTCLTLGQIVAIDDVRQIPSETGVEYGDGTIPFHSDGPKPDIVAWFCLHQDEEDGATILTDSHQILSKLSDADQDQLKSVTLPYIEMAGADLRETTYDLLYGSGPDDWRLAYAPWYYDGIKQSQRNAIDRFAAHLATAEVLPVRLVRNESLFIDNWRMLHARGPLSAQSPRHLKRVWLRTNRSIRSQAISPRLAV